MTSCTNSTVCISLVKTWCHSWRPFVFYLPHHQYFTNTLTVFDLFSRSTANLLHVLVSHRLYYPLLLGLPYTSLHKQNHSSEQFLPANTSFLHTASQTPDPFPDSFKVLHLSYKNIHNLTPPCCSDLLLSDSLSCSPRSSSGFLLIPPACFSTLGSGALSPSLPCLWSSWLQNPCNIDPLLHSSYLQTHFCQIFCSTHMLIFFLILVIHYPYYKTASHFRIVSIKLCFIHVCKGTAGFERCQ